MPLRSNTNRATPVPYEAHKYLTLRVNKSFDDPPFPKSVRALITSTLNMTMSPVLNVMTFDPIKPRPHIQAVLKLYDRRFGTDLREGGHKYVPHTAAKETEFHSFVRRGKMKPFLRELEKEKKTSKMGARHGLAHKFLDHTLESDAKFEAAQWWKCNEYFNVEAEAYERLKDLQGKSIPRVYAYIRFMPSDVPSELRHSPMARYFEVKGILLERITGYASSNIATSPDAPSEPEKCQDIIQAAVDAVHDINTRGVYVRNMHRRDVLIDRRSQTPFIIDLAESRFKDKMIALWKESGPNWAPKGIEFGDWVHPWDRNQNQHFEDESEDEEEDEEEDEDEDEEWDPEVEYWKCVSDGVSNPYAIGTGLSWKMREKTGVVLDIKYPDHGKIIEDIKRQKAAGLGKEDVHCQNN